MAIQSNVTHRGINIISAYIRIQNIQGGKHGGWLGMVNVYASAEIATTNPAAMIHQFNIHAPYDAMQLNPYVALYDALKSMPEYSAAMDV